MCLCNSYENELIVLSYEQYKKVNGNEKVVPKCGKFRYITLIYEYVCVRIDLIKCSPECAWSDRSDVTYEGYPRGRLCRNKDYFEVNLRYKTETNRIYTMTENGESLAPDSWDQEDAQATSDVASQLSNLNVNAPAFVPGQNVFAAEFVPSFQKEAPGKLYI